MFKKSLKQKLLEKLYKEHGIMLDPCDMESFRRRGFGSRVVSWATIKSNPPYQSFETMANCLKYPTKLVRWNFGQDREITIEIDWSKVENAQHITQTDGCPNCKILVFDGEETRLYCSKHQPAAA